MRLRKGTAFPVLRYISIHAPLTGCDQYSYNPSLTYCIFQSTHPLRDATVGVSNSPETRGISIHAPLTGCDYVIYVVLYTCRKFQSTHPLRDATQVSRTRRPVPFHISIHAPLTGCDLLP